MTTKHSLLKKFTHIACISLLSSALSATAQNVFESPELVPLLPEKNAPAQLQKLDNFGNYQLTQPDGSTLMLENVKRFETGDFNFDEYSDFLAVRDQGFNTHAELFVYNPKNKRYALLQTPAQVQQKMLCPGFYNLKIILSADKKPVTLSSSCMAKRSTEVHFDYLKYNSNGELWLSQQYLSAPLNIPEELQPYTDLPWGITAKMTEYSQQGEITKEQRTSHALDPVVVKILSPGIALQKEPSSDAKAIQTLAPAQICALLDLEQEWLKLECPNSQGQKIIGWLHWAPLIKNKTRALIITESKLTKQY